MRTPDDDASGADPGSLAEGYGAADIDDNYGDGFSDPAASDPAAVSEPADTTSDVSLDPFGVTEMPGSSAYDVDPGGIGSDTDLDLTGDGTVEVTDAIEGATALLSFGLDHVEDDDQAAAHDDGGLFDL